MKIKKEENSKKKLPPREQWNRDLEANLDLEEEAEERTEEEGTVLKL